MELGEDEVIRKAQLAGAADEKFREAATLRKQATQLVEALKADPIKVLSQLGIDTRGMTESYLAKELQREMLSPEQRELQELRDYRKAQEEAAKGQEAERTTAAQRAHVQQMQQRAAQEYDVKITDVLKQSNLPKTAQTVKRVAELMHSALSNGYELDVQTAVDMVRENYMTDLQAMLTGLEGEHLEKFVGGDTLKKMRKHDLARLKAQLGQTSTPQVNNTTASPRSQPASTGKHLTPAEWIDQARKKAGL